MNKALLKLTHDSLMTWLTKCREETVSADKKLEIIMLGLADICTALATDGTEESINAYYADGEIEDKKDG
jgi:hypothetical protein